MQSFNSVSTIDIDHYKPLRKINKKFWFAKGIEFAAATATRVGRLRYK